MYDRFAKLLKARGITPHTVSKATGITSATFSSWKQGVYTPKLEKMQKIADFLGVSAEYLMGRTDNPTPTNKLIEDYNNSLQTLLLKPNTPSSKINDIFNSLTEENQRALLEYADFLLYKQNKNRP